MNAVWALAVVAGFLLVVAVGLLVLRAQAPAATKGGALPEVTGRRPPAAPGQTGTPGSPGTSPTDVWGGQAPRSDATTTIPGPRSGATGPAPVPAPVPPPAPGTTARGAPTKGLVAYYSFDEGSGTAVADGSGNGRNGTVDGARWTAGKVGSALDFAAAGARASVGRWTLPAGAGAPFSIAAWVKPGAPAADARTIAAKRDRRDDMMWQFHIAANRDNLGLSHADDFAYFFHGPEAGRWNHVALVYDGTQMHLYVDGYRRGSETASVGGSLGATVTIGGLADGGGSFGGAIDEVYFYDRALEWGDVLALQKAGE